MSEVRVVAAQAADLDAARELLQAAGLPLAGLDELDGRLWLARDGATTLGCVGLEVFGQDALLRSLCVAPAARGQGVGDLLVRHALRQAAVARLRSVYLLTTTAAEYFPRHGFRRIDRDAAPAAVRRSAEFASLCPASAVAMHREVAAS